MLRRGLQMLPAILGIKPLCHTIHAPMSVMSRFQPTNIRRLTSSNHKMFAVHTVNLPNLADSITEGRVQEIKKQAGEAVEVDETVAVIETDKVSVEIKAPKAGVITKYYAKVGEDLAVGKPFFDIDQDAKAGGGAAKEDSKASDKKESKKDEKKEEKKDDKKEEKKEDREVKKEEKKEDKKESAPPKKEERPAEKKEGSPAKSDQPKSPPSKEEKKPTAKPSIFSSSANVERKTHTEPLSKLRMKVGQRLKDSQNTYALLTTFQQVDMGEVMEIRKAYQEEFVNKYGIKLGFMSFFVKAVVAAMQENPIVNAVIDGTNMVQRNYIDISVAVATPTGLMVPVLRNCQSLKFHEIELQLAELAKKGKNGKLTLEDINGGTFTISNGGTFGSLMGTPIVNPPQSAILGMHAVVNRPVVKGDQIVARPMMYLALTYDHRLLDGKDAVLFLKRVQNCVEDPKRILLEV